MLTDAVPGTDSEKYRVSGTASPLTLKRANITQLLLRCRSGVFQEGVEDTMFTGTLIDDLLKAVERAEEDVRLEDNAQGQKLAYWYAVSRYELAEYESSLAGVA